MKAKCSSSSDLISGLPQNIIESILCMVSTRDAVKTSILSKNWRYSWTRIPELLFMDFMLIKSKDKQQEEEDEENTKKEELTRKYEVFNAINQVLSKHQGSILEFALFMHIYDECVEIDQIITYLSRKNTVKKLTLSLEGYPSLYKLHSSFFSLNQLTYISLRHCILDHQPTVNGFGQLTSLFLDCVVSSKELFLHVVSKSPLLKSFTMININTSDDDGYSHIFSHAFICELFGYMPVIEQLHLESSYEYFRQFDSYLPMIPTPLLHLKYVHLDESFFMGNGLPFAVSLIRSSPNMEKLKLEGYKKH
ncbi:F-box/FBD/LRR-repeat protein At1g13570-like [Rutidosis leptorrhynchoides]|uniref:F-box/FBD/LRR-repeat protein At1g13570-like n=1 Tax=Rutidosis leptorrhynchoides TaxID=125765 RepID=UPI003A99DCF2